MIRGYFGLPGAGKTYSMVRDVLSYRGKTIYANFHLNLPDDYNFVYLSNPVEFIKIKSGVVLLDEAGLWLPSFIWKKIPDDLLFKLAQVRKFELDLFYSAQNPARVVKVLREITFESVWTEKWFSFILQRVKAGIDDSLISWRILRLSEKIFSLYDTYERVNPLGKEDLKYG